MLLAVITYAIVSPREIPNLQNHRRHHAGHCPADRTACSHDQLGAPFFTSYSYLSGPNSAMGQYDFTSASKDEGDDSGVEWLGA